MDKKQQLELEKLELEVAGMRRNRWYHKMFTPIGISLLLGMLGFGVNIYLTDQNNSRVLQAEREKFQYQILLKATESGNINEAKDQLYFYRALGLLDTNNSELNKRLKSMEIPVKSLNSQIFSVSNQIGNNKFLLGDLDNDGEPDTAFVRGPQIELTNEDSPECADSICWLNIRFSNSLPTLAHKNAIDAIIDNVGDLDEDGVCEVGVVTFHFTSYWRTLYIYSYKKGSWKQIAKVSFYAGNTPYNIKRKVKKVSRSEFVILEDNLDVESRNYYIIENEKRFKIFTN